MKDGQKIIVGDPDDTGAKWVLSSGFHLVLCKTVALIACGRLDVLIHAATRNLSHAIRRSCRPCETSYGKGALGSFGL